MTTNSTTNSEETIEPVEEPTEVPEETTAAAETPEETTTEEPTGSKREARYRRQLRETEGERDQLTEQLTAMRRAEAERLAGEILKTPAGLWAADVDVADLLDDNGTVAPAKVTEAAKAAQVALGLEQRRANYVPSEGRTVTMPKSSTTFASGFAPH